MSRWKYRTEKVEFEENALTVRAFTAGERSAFAALSKKVKAGDEPSDSLTRFVVQSCTMEPLSDDEIRTMPGGLQEKVIQKVLELSGMSKDDEKKEPEPDLHPNET